MTAPISAELLIAHGLLDVPRGSHPAEALCQHLATRVLVDYEPTGTAILRVNDQARWQSSAAFGSAIDFAHHASAGQAVGPNELIMGIKQSFHTLSSGEPAPDGQTAHLIGLQSPQLGLLVVIAPKVLEFTDQAVRLLRWVAESTEQPGSGRAPSGADGEVAIELGPGFFTNRQLAVLELISQGKSNTEIGKELSISASLAKLEVAFVMHALRAKNRLDTVVKAQQWGITASTTKRGNSTLG